MTGPAERLVAIPTAVVVDAAAGDRAAFTELVSAYHADMLRLAMVISCDPDLANDAVQAAWQHAWRKLGQLRDPARIRPWLLSIAANEARQALRRRSHLVVMPEPMRDQAAGPAPDPIDTIELGRALATLKPDDRRLIALRYVSGFSAPEIAPMLGLTPEGVRSRLKRILDRLRKELGE
jgi:RNA polymerase sigma-70 factor (ECF subfamily)